MYVSVFVPTTCEQMPLDARKKKASDPRKLELQTVVSCCPECLEPNSGSPQEQPESLHLLHFKHSLLSRSTGAQQNILV